MPEVPTAARFVINTKGQWLRADFAAAYLRAIAGGCPNGGISGKGAGRTKEDQEYLHDQYLHHGGPLAAWPWWTSNHIDGTALDINTGTTAQRWLSHGGRWDYATPGEKIRANEYGLIRTVNGSKHNEPWHFAYNRALDKHRASDLAARLKALGFGDVKAFQKSVKLTADGIDGPLTWAKLLTAKPPVVTPPPVVTHPPVVPPKPSIVPTLARMATLNCHGWNLHEKAWTKEMRTSLVAEVKRLGCSIYMLNECPEYMRDVLRDVLPGGSERWRVATRGDGFHQAILFDSKKWKYGGKDPVTFGPTDYHGGVWATFTQTTTRAPIAVGSYHLPPNVVATGEAQVRYLQAFLKAAPKVSARIAGGDGADASSWAEGWQDARIIAGTSPNRAAGTYGTKVKDRIFMLGAVVRAYTVGPVTPATDHRSVLAQITIPGTITTT